MKTLQFKCELLSDVIINQKAATEGPNETLDFIPGNNFLGIVASELYDKVNTEVAWELFHSGRVRFGDAHPSDDGFRGLKIPASMFYPKLKKASEKCYIHHQVYNRLDEVAIKQEQLKQCRAGFYNFSTIEAKEIKTDKSFAIKSAYDSDKRRSADEQMYGYESLNKGLTLYFEVETDNEQLEEDIKNALIGKKRVGRSRTAQYGLIQITEAKYNDVPSRQSSSNLIAVYADGRLIFLDEYGQPTFRPTGEQLGIDGGEIVWELSQIRTFQYAPYNYKRQCFDTDRIGIEKGSVFIVKLTNDKRPKLASRYVGSYNNEGFGKVIYNPEFLDAERDGTAKFRLIENNSPTPLIQASSNSPLFHYLKKRQEQESQASDVYTIVNSWVEKNEKNFKGKFASQWGTIRAFAMAGNANKPLDEFIREYISHGVKADDWLGKRSSELKLFMDDYKSHPQFREIMVNLAAVMAKKCKDKEENK